MKYEVKFPNHSLEKNFEKVILKIHPVNLQEEIMQRIQKLADNPRPFGEKPFKKLKPPIQLSQYTAQSRIRIGDFSYLTRQTITDDNDITLRLALKVYYRQFRSAGFVCFGCRLEKRGQATFLLKIEK